MMGPPSDRRGDLSRSGAWPAPRGSVTFEVPRKGDAHDQPGHPAAVSREGARGVAAVPHPLEPLDAAEMRQVAAILRADGRLRERVKVIGVTLHEPTREDLRAVAAGRALDREAFVVLLDGGHGETE